MMQENRRTTFHKSVMVNQVIEYLAPTAGKMYVDATFGGGGHTKAILDSDPTCKVIAIDWDMKAIERNAPELEQQYGNRLKVLWGNFGHLYKLLKKEKITQVDGILADFGTSQFQIHEKSGFSFQKDTPLDMRMSPAHQTTTAADIVNNASLEELITIFRKYGEEPQSRAIAQKIIQDRKIKQLNTTKQLVDLIDGLIPVKPFKAKRGIHPATKIFQALRITVNHELENIQSFLTAGIRFLAPRGRLVCISFHSLEDRIVKHFFKEHTDQLETITNKPITANEEELLANPSSRSAKLRAARKINH